MTDEEKETLAKQAQEKIAQAHLLIDEAAALADAGGFTVEFYGGGTYYPKTLFTREEALECLSEEFSVEEIAEWTPEELEENVTETISNMTRDELPEYAELGHWWMPSRNC